MIVEIFSLRSCIRRRDVSVEALLLSTALVAILPSIRPNPRYDLHSPIVGDLASQIRQDSRASRNHDPGGSHGVWWVAGDR